MHWKRALKLCREAGELDAAGKAATALAHDQLEVVRQAYERGQAASDAGASREAIYYLIDEVFFCLVDAQSTVDELLSDPELAPHTAAMRCYCRTQLSQTFAAMGDRIEAIAQLEDSSRSQTSRRRTGCAPESASPSSGGAERSPRQPQANLGPGGRYRLITPISGEGTA